MNTRVFEIGSWVRVTVDGPYCKRGWVGVISFEDNTDLPYYVRSPFPVHVNSHLFWATADQLEMLRDDEIVAVLLSE